MTKTTTQGHRETRDQKVSKNKTSQRESMPRFASLEKSAKIAEHYGFSLLPKVQVTRHDMHVARLLRSPADQIGPFSKVNTDELSAMLRTYTEKYFIGCEQQPPMLYFEGSLPRENETSLGATRQITLDIIGSSKSIAEAALIHTAHVILTEEYGEDMIVEINSLGDRESAARFNRELQNYYKKFTSELPTALRNMLKTDPSMLVSADHPRAKELALEAPQSISCLSEASRTQFKEVLEFMETLGIPYRVNPSLIANRNVYAETVFVIRKVNQAKDEEPCAIGFRYNPVSKKIGLSKELPAARAVIYLEKGKVGHVVKKPKAQKPRKAMFYCIHIGFEAKLKSLSTLEALRRAKTPVAHSLIKDKLTTQLISAEQYSAPYILLMGQKESLENTVLVRAACNSSQETVALKDLISYLKKLK